MKTSLSRPFVLLAPLALLALSAGCHSGAPAVAANAPENARTLYARCNLKVLKGTTITWVNWQAAPEFIPVGTTLEVWGGPEDWSLHDPANGRTYTLETGAAGEEYLGNFVSTVAPRYAYTEDVTSNIQKAIAVVGMTREQVYVAMGPPTSAGGTSTQQMTRDRIMGQNTWVWRRRRFGKNIGVTFNPASGTVTGTEGIWKK